MATAEFSKFAGILSATICTHIVHMSAQDDSIIF